MKDYLKLHTNQAACKLWLESTNYINPNISIITDSNNIIYIKDISLVTPPTVKLNAYGYATYCSEYPLDFSNTIGYTAWQITGNDVNDDLQFEQITRSVVAGTGIMLTGDANQTITLTFSLTTNNTILTNNKLIGTVIPMHVDNGKYHGLSGNKFLPINSGIIRAHKAILPSEIFIK